MSGPAEIGHLLPGSAVHLLPAGEVFRHGYGGSTFVAVCGELVTSGSDGEEDPSYCPDCVSEAIRWSTQPWPRGVARQPEVEAGTSSGLAAD